MLKASELLQAALQEPQLPEPLRAFQPEPLLAFRLESALRVSWGPAVL